MAMSRNAPNISDGVCVAMPESARLELAVNRILETWSLIKQVDESEFSELRLPLAISLCHLKDLSDHQLFVAGLKYLYVSFQNRAPERAKSSGSSFSE
jgi:hypothetical protein